MRQYYFNLFFLFSIVCTANKLSGQNEIEPNNNFQTANRISVNSITSGVITNGSDNDVYSFEVTTPGAVLFNLRLSLPPGVSIQLQLYSANQTSIDYGYVDNNGGIFKELICEKGIYYFVLSTFYGSPINVPYKLETTLDLEDSYECNNKIDDAKLINVNSTIKAKLLDAGDQDYYAIRVKQPGVLSFNTQISLPKGTSINTQLYSPNKLPIENGGEHLTKIVCDTGIYYFLIYTFSGSLDNTIYSLESTLFVDDKYECNNNSDAAALIPLCDTITATIYDENDYDYFNFRANNGDSLTFKFLELSIEQEFSVDIFNQKSFFTSAGGNKGEKFELKFVSRDTNLFTIRIKSNQPSLTPYKFIVSNQACKENQVLPILAVKHIHVLPKNPLFSKERVLETIKSNESGNKFFQVCADGSDASIFEISITDARDYDLSTLGIRIAEDNNNQNSGFYGNFSFLKIEKGLLRISYLHPSYYGTEDLNLFKIFNLELFDKNSSKIISTFKIRVFRAPVLMVHGLWGDSQSFQTLNNQLLASERYLPEFLKIANYKSTNDERFERNQNVVPDEVNSILNTLLSKRVSCGKVDIVAHSMGGLVTRYYLQSSNYRNDINRLITLNTPHSGSHLANLLLDKNTPLWDKLFFCQIGLLVSNFPDLGASCYDGAVEDLQVDSKTIILLNTHPANGGNLNRNKVPSHSIVTTLDIFKLDKNNSYDNQASEMLNIIPLNSEEFNHLFFNEKHDVIVSGNSQKGGLDMESTDAVSYFRHFHVGSYQDVQVMDRVEFLLGQNPQSRFFAQNGYKPITEKYSTPEKFLKPQNTLNSLTLEMLNPKQESTVLYGDIIRIQIKGNEKVAKGHFITSGDVQKFEGNKYEGELIVTPKYLGKFPFIIYGEDDKGKDFIFEKPYIQVTTNKIPIKIEPVGISEFVHVGEKKHVYFISKFDTFDVNIAGAPKIQYHFEKGLAKYAGDGLIEGLIPGTDILTITFNGVTSKPLIVQVLPSQQTTGLMEYKKIDQVASLEVFPNPTSSYIIAKFLSKEHKSLEVLIHDFLGRQLQKSTIKSVNGENLHTIPLGKLSNGIYLLSLYDGVEVISRKIVIQN